MLPQKDSRPFHSPRSWRDDASFRARSASCFIGTVAGCDDSGKRSHSCPNGYTIDLRATPSSVDRDGQEGVDSEGKIKGPSSTGRDTATVLVASGGGAYIGALAGGIANGAPGRGALIGGGATGIGALIAILAKGGPGAQLPRGTGGGWDF